MKNKIFFALLAVVLFSTLIKAQNQTADWVRAQSDNGEFSIEVPAEYGFFADKDGFSVSGSSNTYFLQEMNMLNAFHDKTLLSFESYKGGKSALDAIRERDAKKGESSEIKRDGYNVKQIIIKNQNSYTIRQYFNSKNYIYILTAASRNGETPALRRFLDSVVFKPLDAKTNQAPTVDSKLKTILFSALKATPIEVDANPQPLQKSGVSSSSLPAPQVKDENASPLVILYKSPASYTNAARIKGEEGIVRLRITFSQAGYISKIAFLKSLGEGLLRQAVFAALRIKFIPQEKDGKPQTATKIIEYSFDVY